MVVLNIKASFASISKVQVYNQWFTPFSIYSHGSHVGWLADRIIVPVIAMKKTFEKNEQMDDACQMKAVSNNILFNTIKMKFLKYLQVHVEC